MNFETSPCHVDHFLKTKYCYAIEQIISLFCYYEKNTIFSWKLSSKMLVLKKVKSHSEKKDGKFLSTEKICKKTTLTCIF